MQKVYFIQGAGRSGLELLTSLFDGADEILCLPFTLKIIDIWKKKIKNNYSNFDELFFILKHKTKLRYFLDKSKKLSYVNTDIFFNNLYTSLKDKQINIRNILNSIFESYALSINKDIKKIKIFLTDNYYHVDEIEDCLKEFPEAKFVRIIRDPRSNAYSLCRHLISYQKTMHPIFGPNKFRSLPNYILKDVLLRAYKISENAEKNYGKVHRIIKYESLINETEEQMINLCDWFEIKFEKKMLLNTRNGELYETYSKTKLSNISTVDKEIVLNWSKNFNKFNLRALEFIFFDYIKYYNYKTFFQRGHLSNSLSLISCLYPWEKEFLTDLNIIDKKKNYSFYNILKIAIFFLINIFGYLLSRIKLLYLISKGEFSFKKNLSI